jgi:hypothetical protein
VAEARAFPIILLKTMRSPYWTSAKIPRPLHGSLLRDIERQELCDIVPGMDQTETGRRDALIGTPFSLPWLSLFSNFARTIASAKATAAPVIAARATAARAGYELRSSFPLR